MQTFRVPDMTCGGCVRAITNAVKEADPAANVEPWAGVRLDRLLSEVRGR